MFCEYHLRFFLKVKENYENLRFFSGFKENIKLKIFCEYGPRSWNMSDLPHWVTTSVQPTIKFGLDSFICDSKKR